MAESTYSRYLRMAASGGREKLEEISNINVSLRVQLSYGVVHVPGFPPPRVEDYLLVRMVGVQCRDDATDGIVEQSRTDTGFGHLRFRLVELSTAKKRLVLPHGLAFVIVNNPPLPNPPGIHAALRWMAV